MDIKFGNIKIQVVLLDTDKPNLNKYLSNNLAGVLYFGNFSSQERSQKHSEQLEHIIKSTSQNCLISFTISQKDPGLEIDHTNLPHYLNKAKGRTISLFDLSQSNMNIGKSMIESLDKLVEVIART